MSLLRSFSPRMVSVMLVALSLVSISSSTVRAQFGNPVRAIKIKEPVAYRVYQRDANGKAEIPIVLDDNPKPEFFDARVNGVNMGVQGIKLVDGKLVGVPVGGPYTITCNFSAGPGKAITTLSVGPVFVGDLWVVAGQSNMQGVGDLIDVTPPNPRVMLLGMDDKWRQAEEPLHWLVDSPDPVHSGDPNTRSERSVHEHKTRTKGSGLGLPFAVSMVESTGVPIGLIASAHGGTSMEQWSPAKKEQGGHSLYGSMLRQVKLAGGKVRGVLWYQGESDAMGGGWKVFPRVFSDFIAAVRSDFGQPELPFYYVQIGRFVNGSDPKGWNVVQDAQRVLVDRIADTAVVSVIDLELDDGIHVGTQGLKRAGQRLARIAERELFGQVGATTPTFERVSKGPNNTLVVKFKGVNMGAAAPPRMGGQAMMGGSGMTMGRPMMGMGAVGTSPGENGGIGLRPERHIAGFSIRKEDGTAVPLIFEAGVGRARDTVILKLSGAMQAGAALWYGYGLDAYCNLTDGSDMAVPVFGPIALDEVFRPAPTAAAVLSPAPPAVAVAAQPSAAPVKLLVITGDHGHAWKDTTKALSEILGVDGQVKVDVTTTPSKDLTDDNLAKYDVLLLNYKDTAKGTPETRWSEANKQAFLQAVRGGKGLVVLHHASSAFIKPNWNEYEKAVAGGWRSQGFHGPKHVFTVKKTDVRHAISEGLPAQFEHAIDELYQNSVMVPGSVVLATAYSDPAKPRGTGKDEPVIWVNSYGQGRVYENVLGHDVVAMADPKYRQWLRRGVIWAAAAGSKSASPTTHVESSRPAAPAQKPQAASPQPTRVLTSPGSTAAAGQLQAAPIKVLIITGDNVSAHNWRETSKAVADILENGGHIKVDITSAPSKDLTDENLAKYDVLLLNYKETGAGPPESRWSDSNKVAFLKAVHDGKGLVAYHFASSAFTKPNWDEFEKAVAGGWRTQGFHGPAHVFAVKKTDVKHPISDGLPAEFEHTIDELYQNSMLLPGSVVLATAYSDPNKPRGTGKDEPVIWVSSYGKGRVYENVLGHDSKAMADPKYQDWLRRGVIWTGTGK